LVKANEQCAEMFPRSFRFGVSADDEFLLLMQLNLDPCSASLSGLVPGTGAFTDQTFKPEFITVFFGVFVSQKAKKKITTLQP
jgi:hypothetical protein